jgi:hypothetical protein
MGVTMKPLGIMAICLSLVLYAGIAFPESDEICCTWFNVNYVEGKFPQKIMFHYDGTYASYKALNSSNALSRGMFQVVKKWQDEEGYIWYKIIMDDPRQGKKYQLARVSHNGRQLEFICNNDSYPAELNPNETGYCSYRRLSMDYEGVP